MSVALILGGGSTVREDVEAALDIGEASGAVACNHIGVLWPSALDAHCSLHTDRLRLWTASRAKRGLPPHKRVIGSDAAERRFAGQGSAGSSGLFALKLALVDLGFDRAVLCGVPMTQTPHFNDAVPWAAAMQYRQAFLDCMPQIADRARSMSGWTREHLGAPDSGWWG